MLSSRKSTAGPDPGAADTTFYVTDDHMGESGLQWQVSHLLVELLRYYFEVQRQQALVSGNQFVHFRQGDPGANLAPDVYVIPEETTAPEDVKSWKLWEHGGKGPALALEVVAEDGEEARKDYAPELLEKYEAIGVAELFRYDPQCGAPPRRLLGQPRRLLTHFVRDEAGKLIERPLLYANRTRSARYDFWLVHRAPRQLRIGVGPEGLLLWPTRAEAEARRAEDEARRAEAEAGAAEEARRQLGEAQEREAALRAELERLRAERKEP